MGVEVKAEDNVGVEATDEGQASVAEVVKEVRTVRVPTKVKDKERGTLILVIRLNVIQILHHSSHVFVTGHLEKVHISVWSRLPVLGRTFTCPSLTNETLTNSTKMTRNLICFLTISCQKYTPS